MPSKGHSHIPATYVLQLPLQLLLAQPINISYYFEKNIIFSLPSFFTFMVYKKEEIKSEIDLKDSNKLQFPFALHILNARNIVECHTLKHIRKKVLAKTEVLDNRHQVLIIVWYGQKRKYILLVSSQ